MKKKLISLCLSFALAGGLGCGFDGTAHVSAEEGAFVMKVGASVRLTDGNGIRFSAEISETEYQAIETESVSYGMLIMPADYLSTHGGLTIENVFGEKAVYDWAVWDETANDWSYTTSESKTRIINLEYETLPSMDGKRVVNGSIVKILPQNLDREFVGRAYIKEVTASGTSYRLADYYGGAVKNNTRSMLSVAAMAYTNQTTLTGAQRTALKTEYIVGAGYETVSTVDEFSRIKSGKKYILLNDLDFSGKAFGGGINVSGVLDGNGYALKNLAFSGADGQGVFGEVSGTVKNMKIENLVFKGWDSGNSDSEFFQINDCAPVLRLTANGVLKNLCVSVTFNATGGYSESIFDSDIERWYGNWNAGLVARAYGGAIDGCSVNLTLPRQNSYEDGTSGLCNVASGCSVAVLDTVIYENGATVYEASDGFGTELTFVGCEIK